MRLYNNVPNGLFKTKLIKPPSNIDLSRYENDNSNTGINNPTKALISQYIYIFIDNIIQSFSL